MTYFQVAMPGKQLNTRSLRPGNGGYPPPKKPTLAPEPAPPPSLQSPAPHPDAPAPAPFCSSPAVAPNRATAPPDHSGESPPSPNRCSALAILLRPPPQST